MVSPTSVILSIRPLVTLGTPAVFSRVSSASAGILVAAVAAGVSGKVPRTGDPVAVAELITEFAPPAIALLTSPKVRTYSALQLLVNPGAILSGTQLLIVKLFSPGTPPKLGPLSCTATAFTVTLPVLLITKL